MRKKTNIKQSCEKSMATIRPKKDLAGLILHHNNAPVHKASVVGELLGVAGWGGGAGGKDQQDASSATTPPPPSDLALVKHSF